MDRVGWVAFWAGFAALDYYAARRNRSLSRATRLIFHTHTPLGRAVLAASLGAGSGTLLHHLISGDRENHGRETVVQGR